MHNLTPQSSLHRTSLISLLFIGLSFVLCIPAANAQVQKGSIQENRGGGRSFENPNLKLPGSPEDYKGRWNWQLFPKNERKNKEPGILEPEESLTSSRETRAPNTDQRINPNSSGTPYLMGNSGIKHWDTSAMPNLLMDPSLNKGLPFWGLDTTPVEVYGLDNLIIVCQPWGGCIGATVSPTTVTEGTSIIDDWQRINTGYQDDGPDPNFKARKEGDPTEPPDDHKGVPGNGLPPNTGSGVVSNSSPAGIERQIKAIQRALKSTNLPKNERETLEARLKKLKEGANPPLIIPAPFGGTFPFLGGTEAGTAEIEITYTSISGAPILSFNPGSNISLTAGDPVGNVIATGTPTGGTYSTSNVNAGSPGDSFDPSPNNPYGPLVSNLPPIDIDILIGRIEVALQNKELTKKERETLEADHKKLEAKKKKQLTDVAPPIAEDSPVSTSLASQLALPQNNGSFSIPQIGTVHSNKNATIVTLDPNESPGATVVFNKNGNAAISNNQGTANFGPNGITTVLLPEGGVKQITNNGASETSFGFFDPNNIEMVVKALDGRQNNGRLWIFFGSLTNVGFEMKVTDTESGLVKAYTNSSGDFASVGDTNAY